MLGCIKVQTLVQNELIYNSTQIAKNFIQTEKCL